MASGGGGGAGGGAGGGGGGKIRTRRYHLGAAKPPYGRSRQHSLLSAREDLLEELLREVSILGDA